MELAGTASKFNKQGEVIIDVAENFETISFDSSEVESTTELIAAGGVATRIHIHSIYVSTGSNSGEVEVFCASELIFKMYINVQPPAGSGIIHKNLPENCNINISAPANTFIHIVYKIEAVP